MPFSKNCTLEIVPDVAVAFALIVTLVDTVVVPPTTGAVMLTTGGGSVVTVTLTVLLVVTLPTLSVTCAFMA
jgi:hypothetical protein